ncbi:MAG: MerR family transcriptional regulator, thiopeptide resistance regulator [Frankiaceae bacterium]|nr:MerR family transcriptional regulator, thiopeptide resistance regulator [Frankiaceae bacterium]
MTATPSTRLTVGQVAEDFGVTVRTLHHYDEIGLVRPSGRSPSGYRLYDEHDLTRLRHVVVYRRLGLALGDIARLLDGAPADVADHLRRQRAAVLSRLDELGELVAAIDRALEAEMTGDQLTPEEQRDLFGDAFDEAYAAEAEQRWGNTDEWRESSRRTATYSKADWAQIKAEAEGVNAAFAAAQAAGEPATSEVAMTAAEQHRQHISRRFYNVSYAMHRSLGDLYVADARFTATYEALAPGLAVYVRDAIHANADRHAP